MRYWLMKSEPNTFSIDQLEKEEWTHWDGVRNYQARNYMRDEMRVGDLVLFYHSNATPPGVAGVCRVSREAYPDHTAQDPKSAYFDPKASADHPIWMMVDVEFVAKFSHIVSLSELKANKELEGMKVLEKGMRLSIQPVSESHFHKVVKLGRTARD